MVTTAGIVSLALLCARGILSTNGSHSVLATVLSSVGAIGVCVCGLILRRRSPKGTY